jgi:hypothetical protein
VNCPVVESDFAKVFDILAFDGTRGIRQLQSVVDDRSIYRVQFDLLRSLRKVLDEVVGCL